MTTLFWCPKTRSVRALWMLEELGRPYERVLVDIRDRDAERDPRFSAASPMGKVPAIEDGEVRLAESAAICLYLPDRHALGELSPALDDPARGRYLYWMLYTPAVIEPAMSEKFSGSETASWRIAMARKALPPKNPLMALCAPIPRNRRSRLLNRVAIFGGNEPDQTGSHGEERRDQPRE